MKQHRMPSPAILVAVLALVAALAGTAVAGQDATRSAVSKKKFKKLKKQTKANTSDINALQGDVTTLQDDVAALQQVGGGAQGPGSANPIAFARVDAGEDVDEANARMAETAKYWRSWISKARTVDHPYREAISRSALAIKGLTYMPTGATVAALSTSLPEAPGGERNWDYRYCWMRDTTFTLQALHYLNLDWEADEFMQFVADVEPNEDGAMQIMYGIDGRRDLTESTLDHLSGYGGARPVRIGNGAFDQRQNDVFGAVLDSVLLHTRRSERLPRRLWPIVKAQA